VGCFSSVSLPIIQQGSGGRPTSPLRCVAKQSAIFPVAFQLGCGGTHLNEGVGSRVHIAGGLQQCRHSAPVDKHPPNKCSPPFSSVQLAAAQERRLETSCGVTKRAIFLETRAGAGLHTPGQRVNCHLSVKLSAQMKKSSQTEVAVGIRDHHDIRPYQFVSPGTRGCVCPRES